MPAVEPSSTAVVPAGLRALMVGRCARPVWENELGGLTFEIGADPERNFVKWTPAASGIDLQQEVDRLNWAGRYSPVPRVLDQGADEEGSWIVTAALSGRNAVSNRWSAEPSMAVAAIGRGLRELHEALPVASCPFDWSVAGRLENARRRADSGHIDPTRWHEVHTPLGVGAALERLAAAPPVDRLVVCHGDACAPNTMLHEDGSWSGHVDLGELGIADRWADLAVATWSTEWNYGPGWQVPLLDAYGVDPDPDRIGYYRLLWDLGP